MSTAPDANTAQTQSAQAAQADDALRWQLYNDHKKQSWEDKGLTPTTSGEPKVTYNRHHIALGTSGYNFCWFHPRKAAFCHMHIKVGAENRPEIIKRLEEAGIEAGNQSRGSIRLHLNVKDTQDHRDLIADVIRIAEEWSHR